MLGKTSKNFFDFAASRAYYTAFYCATAVLLNDGLDFSKHSGVIASIHQRFVKISFIPISG
ncbi:HEPN domain-containing protein [Candidatus Sumerlaeota bacterium]|nr:HEPN domain-containing protein [Candidatus Sumerlaeota bacterium]